MEQFKMIKSLSEINSSDFSWKKLTKQEKQKLIRTYRTVEALSKRRVNLQINEETLPENLQPMVVFKNLSLSPGLNNFVANPTRHYEPTPAERGYIRMTAHVYSNLPLHSISVSRR